MRRLLKAGMMLFLVGALQVSSFASQNIQVKVNNSTLQLQNELVVRDGNVYISVRDIGEALGYEFSWSKDNKTANLKSEDLIIALQPNNRWFSKKKRDGSVATFQFGAKEAPIMVNNTMYVPLGNFTRVAEGRIDWDSNKGVYNIIYGEKLDYVSKAHLNLYAGNGKKGALDGPVKESQFAFAQSICFGKNKEIYVSDSGRIRKIKNGVVETLSLQPSNVKVTLLRGNEEIYALSTAYEDDNKQNVYSIFKLEEKTLVPVYTQKSNESKIIDFDRISAKLIAVLREEIKTGKRYLDIVDIKDGKMSESVEVEDSFNSVAASEKHIYLGNNSKATIYCYDLKDKKLALFAGTEEEHQYVDGSNPLFCGPRKLKYYDKALYVLDHNILRKISISIEGKMTKCQTVAGEPTALMNATMSSGTAKNLKISATNPVDFAVNGEDIVLTDANQFKIMRIGL